MINSEIGTKESKKAAKREPLKFYVLQAINASEIARQLFRHSFRFNRAQALELCKRVYPLAFGYHAHEALTLDEAFERLSRDEYEKLVREAESEADFLRHYDFYRAAGQSSWKSELAALIALISPNDGKAVPDFSFLKDDVKIGLAAKKKQRRRANR